MEYHQSSVVSARNGERRAGSAPLLVVPRSPSEPSEIPVNARRTAHPAAKIASLVMVLVGALVIGGSVFADQLNLIGGGAGFGWKQLLGAIGGLALLLLGVAWLLQPAAGDDLDDFVE